MVEACLAVAVALSGFGCEREAPSTSIVPAQIDPSVVAFVAARDDIPEDQARERANDSWRLAQAYLAEHEGQPPSRARRAHLERTALARLWLREDFETRHDEQSIPSDAVTKALDDPRVIHPRIHVVCQAIVAPPADADGKSQPAPKDEAWRAEAQGHAQRLAQRLERYVGQPELERDCSQIQRVVNLSPAPEREDMRVLQESGVFEACRDDLWEAGFVDALCPRGEPGVVGPFWTKYGAHVVVMLAVEPDIRAGTKAARDLQVRRTLLPSWRSERYPDYIARLRARLDVRRIEGAP